MNMDTNTLGITKMAESMDITEAINKGYLVKYEITYPDQKSVMYSRIFFYIQEIRSKKKVKNISIDGPIPLIDCGIEDSIINRWESEKRAEKNDLNMKKRFIKKAIHNKNKYVYLLYGDIFKVRRLIAHQFSKSILSNEDLKTLFNKDILYVNNIEIVRYNTETKKEVRKDANSIFSL